MGALSLVMAIAGAGCDDTPGDTDPQAQPAPEVTSFAEGQFGEIPLVPGSQEAQPRSQLPDGTITASYIVDNIDVSQVRVFYEEALPPLGWQLINASAAPEQDFYRSDWASQDRRLEISADVAPAVGGAQPGEDTTPTVQYSLVLSPNLADNPPTTPAIDE